MKPTIIFFAAISAISLSGCDMMAKKAQTTNTTQAPTAKQGEKVIKNFDVDSVATEALKTEINAKFKSTATTEEVETALKTQSYECRIDPTNKNERGCDKMETKDNCIVMSVIKTLPFTPSGAQVIKVCDVGQ